jgi:hypothetical protein
LSPPLLYAALAVIVVSGSGVRATARTTKEENRYHA